MAIAERILSNTVFGVFEILGYIIPGSIVAGAFALLVGPISVSLPDSFVLVLLIFVSFVIGVGIQSLSFIVEEAIFRIFNIRRPSKYLLDADSKELQPYLKEAVRRLAADTIGVPSDAEGHHIFQMCYNYILQVGPTARISRFLSMYSFCRNMSVTLLIVLPPLDWFLGAARPLLLFPLDLTLIGGFYLFFKQYLRYSDDFAKEVLRTFYVYRRINPE